MVCKLPRLLALDIDGTITTSRHDVSARTIAAIRRAADAGLEVVLATGRRYSDALPVAAALGVTNPLVTTAGALIKDPRTHRTQFCAGFASGVLADLLNLIDQAGHEAVVYTDSFREGFDFHCRSFTGGSEGLRSYLSRNRSRARFAPQLHKHPPEDAFAAFCMGAEDDMVQLEDAIRSAHGDTTSVHVIRSPRYRGYLCEIAPAGVTKWSGVLHLAAQLDITSSEICAVGDDLNDLPMIDAAGLGVAMGNADPRVQAAADQVTGTNDADGLVDLIDQLLAASA